MSLAAMPASTLTKGERPRLFTCNASASEKLVRSRCLPEFEIPSCEPQRPVRVRARLEPEFRCVIGEGLRVPHHQLVISRCRLVTPRTGLLRLFGLAEDARE